MKQIKLLEALVSLLFIMGFMACGNNDEEMSEVEMEEEQEILAAPNYKGYEIQFECDDLDADEAVLFYNKEINKGWFGWFPSNGAYPTYIVREIESLSFTEIYPEFWGVDKSDEFEEVNISFDLEIDDDGNVTGTGVFLNENGDVENCTLSNRENESLNITTKAYQAFEYAFSCEDISADNAIVLVNEDYSSIFFGWEGQYSGEGNIAVREIKNQLDLKDDGFSFEEIYPDFYGVSSSNTEDVMLSFNVEIENSEIEIEGQMTRENGVIETCTSN